MKRTTLSLYFLALAALLMAVSGCDRYRVTVNERVISEPGRVLASVDVADDALKACIEQTARDRQIRTTDQLRTLVCTHGGIRDLEGIQVFSKLGTLNLANNELTTIAPLLFLGSLESVNLEGNGELDCGEVKSLQKQLPGDATLIAPGHC